MEIKDHKQIIRITDVVHVYDKEKNINWFICFESTNEIFQEAREMMNYEFFKKQGSDYMQKVYDLAYETIKKEKG